MKKTNLTSILIFACALYSANADAKIIMATTCNATDVQTAINAATDGDTVVMPSGTCVWSSQVKIESKSIILKGGGIDQTIIIDNAPSGGGNSPLKISNSFGKVFRITGFTIDGRNARALNHSWGEIYIVGSSKDWRVDHIKIKNNTYRGIVVAGQNGETFGVIDHCIFEVTSDVSAQGVSVFGDNRGTIPGDYSWNLPLSLGTANAIYIEDCTFNFSYPADGALDAYGGARFVFRNNTVIGTPIGTHGFDSGGYRAPHSFEIYDNTFYMPGSAYWTAMGFRGGTGVIYRNVVSGNFNEFALVRNYRSCDDYVCSFGVCNGSSSYDGNQPGMEGYPCRDQIGRTTGQALSPMYAWNNNFKGSEGRITVQNICSRQALHIQENRDFYNGRQMPGYVPYAYPHKVTNSGFTADGEYTYIKPPDNFRISQ